MSQKEKIERLETECSALVSEMVKLKNQKDNLSKLFDGLSPVVLFTMQDVCKYRELFPFNIPLEALFSSVRCFHAIRANELITVADLLACKRETILRTRNIGRYTLRELDAVVLQYKMFFGIPDCVYIPDKKH